MPGIYAGVASIPLHMDIMEIHHLYCCLLTQLAQLSIATIKAVNSLPLQPLVMAHLCSIVQNFCDMDGGMLVLLLW